MWIYKAYDFAGYEVNGTKVTPKKMRYLLDNVMAPEVLVLKAGSVSIRTYGSAYLLLYKSGRK